MNRMQNWRIPVLTTCLVHGAITLLPINFGYQKEKAVTPEVTFRLVSLPQTSPPSFLGKQTALLPKKKPSSPKKIRTEYKDQFTAILPITKPRQQDKSIKKTTSQESAGTEETSAASEMASMQPGTGLGSSTQISQDPVALHSELSVICPKLKAPTYPRQSRQLGEYGDLMLRLELDKKGRVVVAQVMSSSGYKRLDDAAITAVKTWRCNPPLRDGQPVRAIALQPFSFVLQ